MQTTLDRLADQYFNYILVEKGLAKKTIESYSRDIVRFLLYLKDHGIDTMADIDTRVILQYLIHRQSLVLIGSH